MLVTAKTQINFKSGKTIDLGSRGRLTFPAPEESRYGLFSTFTQNGGGEAIMIRNTNLPRYFGFKRPSEAVLERWMFDGGCKTVTGKWVEPDGYADDNSPSWLVALGLI